MEDGSPGQGWEEELERWLAPFLEGLRRKAQRRWAPFYLKGLLGRADARGARLKAA